MKIGNMVFIHGYIDEIRKDTVIIRNDGGYFGTVPSEIFEMSNIIHCKDCKHHWTHSSMDAFPREICDLDQTFYDSNFDYCSLAERRTDG